MIGQGRTRGQAALLELDAATNQNSAALIPSTKIESEFLHQYLKFRYVAVRALSNSSGQGNLNASLIGGFHVPVPPLAEQRKIAEILRTWDDAIEHAETLVQVESEAFGELRRRLFVSCGQESPLGEVSTRIQRKSDGSHHTVMAISAKTGFVAQADKYRRDMAGASLANYTLLRRGEFAYNKGNSLTYPQGCIYALKADSALVPNIYYSFGLRADLNSSYYEHFFASGALNRQLAQRITSGVRGNGLLNLNADDFFGVKVPVPSRDTQDGAADILNMGARKIQLLQHKAELLRTQRRGLMQKLLTGQLRVNAAAAGSEPGRLDVD
jgi:type I restriction enzyme S subunit